MADSSAANILDPYGVPYGGNQVGLEGASQLGTLNRNWWAYVPPHVGYFWRRIVDSISLETYQLMYETDETVSYAVELLTLAVLSRLGEYTHKRKRIEKFVRDNIEAVPNWRYVCAQILSAVPFGFSASEILWRPEAGRVMIDNVETLHPRSVLFILDTGEQSPTRNQLLEVWQWPFSGYQARLPLEKVILYSHRMEFGNFWGKARLKAAFKNWFIKDQMLSGWAKALDRYGSPTTVARINNARTTVTKDDGTRTTNMQLMLEELERFRGGGTLVYEGNEGLNEVKLWDAPGEMGKSFKELVDDCDKKICRAFLIPSTIIEQGKHGSYSLGKQHFDTFTLGLDFLLQELSFVLTHQLVKRLVELNFGKQDDYGTFAVKPFDEDDRMMLSEVFLNLVNAGVATPENQADLDFMRDAVGLPQAKEGDRQLFVPLAEKKSAAPAPGEENPAMRDLQASEETEIVSFRERVMHELP